MIFINLIEERPIMKTENSAIRKKPGGKGRRPIPEQYICIAEDEAPEVFDWLNGVSDADQEIAEIHLRLCFHCQEAVATMMTLDAEFRARVRRCLHGVNAPVDGSMTTESMDAHSETDQTSYDQEADDKPRSMKVGGGS
jgi:hypothetical protein